MVIVKIVGGLGNQMFQYAYAKALQQKGYELKIDISAFKTYKRHGGYQLDKYDIDLESSTIEDNNKLYKDNLVLKILRKVGFENSKIIKEKTLLFDESLLNVEDNNYIDGYFQSEKYFINIRDILLKQFVIKQDISQYTKDIENKIISSSNSCSIHIRRGDFLNSTNINIHGICDLDYYKKAIDYLEDKIINLHYFVFSDDIEWAKDNVKIDNAIYIDSKEKRLPHEDIFLMSLCKHNIIANSSFSWWGAWLKQDNEKIVVAPKRWFADNNLENQSKDIIPENWIKI